jgi:uncharacterized protein (DUF58 family)
MSAPAADPGSRPFLGPRAIVLYALAAVLTLAAIVFRTSVPLFAAMVFLLAPLASGLLSPRPPVVGRLRWAVAEGTSDVDVQGRLELPESIDPRDVRLRFDRPPPLTEVRPPEHEVEGAAIRFSLHWATPYPILTRVPLPTARWEDPLALASLPVQLEGDALIVERYPPEVARIGSVRLRRTTQLPGEVRSRAVGSGGEFFAVRAAVPSDTSRQINWKASARRSRWMANEFFLERTGDLLILIDLRPTPLGPARDQALAAVARVAALGIASAFLREKSRVGVGVFDEFLRTAPLAAGRVQRSRIARLLESAQVGPVAGPTERFAVSVRRYFPTGLNTLVISSMEADSSEDLLLYLRRRGYFPLVLSPSPLTLSRPLRGREAPFEPLVVRLESLVRRRRLNEVWKVAPVVDWDNFWSLAPLVRFLSTPVRNRESGA